MTSWHAPAIFQRGNKRASLREFLRLSQGQHQGCCSNGRVPFVRISAQLQGGVMIVKAGEVMHNLGYCFEGCAHAGPFVATQDFDLDSLVA